MYRILADIVVVVHVCFVFFVVFGGFLLRRWPNLIYAHVPAAIWGVLIEFGGWICPLTPVEKHFRALGHQAGYPESFVEHYITRVMYPAGLTRGMQVAIGVFVIAVNLAFYWLAFRRPRSPRRSA